MPFPPMNDDLLNGNRISVEIVVAKWQNVFFVIAFSEITFISPVNDLFNGN